MKRSFFTSFAWVLACAFALGQTPEPPKPAPPAPEPPKPAPQPTPTPTTPAPPSATTPTPPKPAVPTPPGAPVVSVLPKKRTVAEVTKNCTNFAGLFRVFADKENGSMYLLVKRDQIRREFIYFSHTVDGVVSSGRSRGQFNDEKVFVIQKLYGKLEFVEQNTSYYFDPEHPLARSAKANISPAILASEGIIAENEEGYLISAGALFLREAFMQVKPSGGKEDKGVLGKLSESKTKFTRWGSYPKNTFFVVEYVFENPMPPGRDDDAKGLQDITDHRYVSIRVQHTLVAMPDSDFQPRVDDPRIGYFMSELTDQTSTEVTPYRDFIHRWNLKKKDPAAPLSEPVEPIVWWIENTTPREFRETIRNAGLLWNKSFEKIGYKNAIVMNEQPDDAKWDAGDLDHNVLRWVSSPKAPYGGYGPHFVNPRTGQILGADIMLEFSFVKSRIMARNIWTELGLAGLSEDKGDAAFDQHACAASSMIQQGLLFGNNVLRLRSADKVDFDTMLKESLTQLILHEMGHTLGLNHNFRASQLHSPEELRNRALTEKTGLSGSVMDYMPLNLGPDKAHQGQFYMNAPGAYDDWAIEYGYSDTLPDAAAEAKRLAAIASRSNEAPLAFANDADDMRTPGKSIDPRAMLFDMSSDPVAYGKERCEIVQKAVEKMLAEYPKPGKSWQELTQAFVTLTTEESNALTAISRYIGGVYVERPFVGQVKENAPNPLRPVEAAKQKAAMAVLARHAFGPDAWKAPESLLSHLQQQRRGFDFRTEGEDPKIHERVLKIQRALLDHLLHVNTQNRILDSALYGNDYPLHQMMADLTQAVMFGEKKQSPINTMRQNLQLDFVQRLINIVKGAGHQPAVQSVALFELKEIEKKFADQQMGAPEANQPHIAYVLFKIKQALDAKNG